MSAGVGSSVASPPSLLHSGNASSRLAWVMIQSLLLTLVGALLSLGWRSALVMVGMVALHAVARRLWSVVLAKPVPKPFDAREWVAPALVACTLPAEAAVGAVEVAGRQVATWPILPAAALLLAATQALRTVVTRPRFEPAVLTIVLLHVLIGPALVPLAVVQRSHAIVGDIGAARVDAFPAQPWHTGDADAARDDGAFRRPGVATTLDDYLSARAPNDSAAASLPLTLDGLLRDRLPPLDDVVALGQTAPIGMASLALLLLAVLHGCYRGLFDARVPVLAAIACYGALVVLPIPVVIEDGFAERRWLAIRAQGVGSDVALTFVHYLLMGTPALFAMGVLANLGDVRPLRRRPRVLWAVCLGASTATSMLAISTTVGPYVAVLVLGALAPAFDRLLRPRPTLH